MYVAAVAAVLGEFSREIIDYVTDPRTGLPRTSKWPPNPAEVAEACEARQRHVQLMAQTRPYRPSMPIGGYRVRGPGSLANVLVWKEAPQYARMVELSKTEKPEEWRWGANGIWVALDWINRNAA